MQNKIRQYWNELRIYHKGFIILFVGFVCLLVLKKYAGEIRYQEYWYKTRPLHDRQMDAVRRMKAGDTVKIEYIPGVMFEIIAKDTIDHENDDRKNEN